MATARVPIKTWVARETDFYLGRTGSTNQSVRFHNAGITLSGSFATSGVSISAGLKNVTVTPPETGWDKQDFCGVDSSGFQNQVLDEKPVGIATVTGTLIVADDELIEDYMVSGTVTSASGYTRYQVGKNNDNKVIACVVMSDSSRSMAFGFDNAQVAKWGDVKLSGPDGHWEQDLTIICLTKDFYAEKKN